MKILKKHSRKLDFLFHKRKSANKRCLKMDCSKEFPQQQKKSYKGLNPQYEEKKKKKKCTNTTISSKPIFEIQLAEKGEIRRRKKKSLAAQ